MFRLAAWRLIFAFFQTSHLASLSSGTTTGVKREVRDDRRLDSPGEQAHRQSRHGQYCSQRLSLGGRCGVDSLWTPPVAACGAALSFIDPASEIVLRQEGHLDCVLLRKFLE